jgi:hypothetical protein
LVTKAEIEELVWTYFTGGQPRSLRKTFIQGILAKEDDVRLVDDAIEMFGIVPGDRVDKDRLLDAFEKFREMFFAGDLDEHFSDTFDDQ